MILIVPVAIFVLYSISSIVLLWIVAKIFWGFTFRGSYFLFFAGWLLVLIPILSIGMLVGGIAKNSKSASVWASVLYFPMLVFSGATLPYEVMPGAMQKVVNILPLTQGIKILKAAVLGLPLTDVTFAIVAMTVLAAVCIGISMRYFRWE